jgi:hypothetical protein
MGHVINRRTHGRRTSFRNHPLDCSRGSDLSGKTLHKNCPNCRRLNAIRETIDGLGFQTCTTTHFRWVGERRKAARLTPLSSGTT